MALAIENTSGPIKCTERLGGLRRFYLSEAGSLIAKIVSVGTTGAEDSNSIALIGRVTLVFPPIRRDVKYSVTWAKTESTAMGLIGIRDSSLFWPACQKRIARTWEIQLAS